MYQQQDHTWVVCAYKESIYLENAIQSVLNQSVSSNVCITTSTPNSFIESMAEKYHLKLFINKGENGIAGDWNFAYHTAQTKLVTLCHQDDIYERNYLRDMLNTLNDTVHPLIAFSNYGELRGEDKITQSKLLKIKRWLLFPLKGKLFRNNRFVRRRCLSLGNCICCPSVTYVKEYLPQTIFVKGYKSNLDWQTWEALSKRKGGFAYVPKVRMYHRIHEASTTTEIIGESLRTKEDYAMFCKFWPRWIAKKLAKVYQKSEKSNEL